MTTTEDTRERIAMAALKHYLSSGIKKTSMEDVAAEAGLTRVTIYRYYPDKKNLVKAAFLYVVDKLQQVYRAIIEAPETDLEEALERTGKVFYTLPQGDLRLAQYELSRLYPDVWRLYLQARNEALDSIFEPLFAKAERRGLLRPGINRIVTQTHLFYAFMDTLQVAAAFQGKASQEEVLQTIKTLFFNGTIRTR
ncbi:MAG TPA: TetR/AcrR family transcriptional regulator [Levilinea sp.]|nr:TetR/AcrR family transcriptional regulator [Levilinea sp.]